MLAPRAWAANSGVVGRLESRYKSISTLRADFTQVSKGLSAVDASSGGSVYFKKPARIKWSYKGAIEDEIIGDGHVLWFYQPDLNQAFKSSGKSPEISTDFLSGMGSIRKHFRATVGAIKAGRITIELEPRQYHQQIKTLTLQVVKKTFLVDQFTLVDHYGNTTEVSFSNISINTPIKDGIFHFTPPEGTVVIDNQPGHGGG